jgi:Cu(I)/Ag(I) efflux system membrane fusion protein
MSNFEKSGAPAGAGFMNVVRWVLFVGLLLLAGASLGRVLAPGGGAGSALATAPAGGREHPKSPLYHCPMHPNYTSDRPGECPICGMSLVRIDAGEHDSHGISNVTGLVPVQLSDERIQRIGVRTAIATRAGLARSASLTGFVTPDESRITRLQVRLAGWVRSLDVNAIGQAVRQGQNLLTLESPDLFQAEQEYVIELGAAESLRGDSTMAGMGGASTSMSHEAPGRAAARQRLRLLGVPDDEVRRLERERVASSRLTFRSPVNGVVLERGVLNGQAISPDTPLFAIADLSRVWVQADLYEQDLGSVHVGDRVHFKADGPDGAQAEGRIEFLTPTVSTETRTVQARIALANPGGRLRPGMFGRVNVAGTGSAALTVPSEAVVHTGEEDYVFLAHAGGIFEPRRVTAGAEDGDRIAISAGIAAGDTVVASASFLIDSESRLKAAIAGLGAQPAAHTHGSTR